MTTPARPQTELAELLRQRASYRYKGRGIEDKILVGIVAPTAVGKSTLIGEILRQGHKQGSDVGEVGSITTRQRRSDGSDPEQYRTGSEGVTHAQLIRGINDSSLINWSLSPTGDLYATDAASYPARYNFLPLLPDSIGMLQKAGFQKFFVIYLTAPVKEWKVRLTDRTADPKFAGRLREAIDSLAYAHDHRNTLCILNNPASDGSQPTELATKILDHLQSGAPAVSDPEAVQNIKHMRTYAEEQLNGTA